MRTLLILLSTLLVSSAYAQEEPKEVPVDTAPLVIAENEGIPPEPQCQNTEGQICVEKEDLKLFLKLAEERKCLDDTTPEFKLDSITIIMDEDGRVFYSGADPNKPYKLEMTWCHYKATGEGEVKVLAAMNEPPTWGFRFRPKAYLGYLPFKLMQKDSDFSSGLDAGLLLDVFYVKWVNFNVAAGFRSTGAGAGFDLTSNFGLYLGYSFAWDMKPTHNLLGAAYFAF